MAAYNNEQNVSYNTEDKYANEAVTTIVADNFMFLGICEADGTIFAQ